MGLDDKIKNKAQEATGKLKEEYADATDNESLEAEGRAEQSESKVRQAGEKVKDTAKDVRDDVKDALDR